MSEQLIELEDLQESYLFGCAVCGHEQRAKPSLFMRTGMSNRGGGSCMACKAYLFLEISGDVMVSHEFDVWLEKMCNEEL